jgi:hypothetical protein
MPILAIVCPKHFYAIDATHYYLQSRPCKAEC